MKTQKYFLVGILIVLIVISVIGICYYKTTNKSTSITPVSTVQTEVTILVPNDLDAYIKAMNEYTSVGGENPAKTWPFIKKTVAQATTTDVIRASAEAAAAQITIHGGPTHVTVAYLKVVDSTAYVVLDIELDAWAGVSFSINQVHPIVEKTLLQFPQIQSVQFGFALGDSRSDVY